MPPKKREKEPELNKTSKLDYVQADHELFLQAFEKPTQIYRFLRTRNLLSPIFLNRTLSYMKQRMSRNNKNRHGFKTDSLLDRVIQKRRSEMELNSLSGYMTLTFLGFYDKYLENSRDYQVKVETLLLKICHKKRKDSSSAIIEVSVGSCSVPLNPSNSEPPAMASAVSISSDTFSPSQGSNVKSYMLLLQVTLTPTQQANGMQTNSEIMNGDGDEPIQKRLKSSSLDQQFSQGPQLDKQTKFYGSELIVYDKHNRCLLTNGEYDLVMHDKPQQHKACITKSPHKALTAQWETISGETSVPGDNNPFDIFKIRPVLKLKLSWSQEATNGLVNRPKTFQKAHDGLFADKVDTTSSNKENDRPGSNLTQKGNTADASSATNPNDSHAAASDKQKLENQDDNENNENLQIIYQFLYNNNSRQQTETCDDLHCPWCSLDCGTLYSLLKHLKLCHSRFSFAYSPVMGGARIDVSVNDRYDGSYAGSPHDLLTCLASSGGRLAPRAGPARRAPVTRILACRPRSARPRPHTMAEFVRETDEGDAAESQRPYISGHNRLYHHTITCLPVYPKELDIDSEGETDPLWLQQKTMMMIDEFTDVNEGEKELMKMWNLHVMKYNFVGDCQIPLACQMFLQDRGRELLQKNLYRNFILHMCSLHDFGLINPIAMHQTIQMLNQMLADNTEAKEAMKKRILLQSHHWIETGMHRQPMSIVTSRPRAAGRSTT